MPRVIGIDPGTVSIDLCGDGRHRVLVETLGIRDAQGSVLDHLYVVSPAAARRRLGLS